jgi:hypothetical protein
MVNRWRADHVKGLGLAGAENDEEAGKYVDDQRE